jgi:hypothetical protein
MPEETVPTPPQTDATTSTGPSSEIPHKTGYDVEAVDSPEEWVLNPPGTLGVPEDGS